MRLNLDENLGRRAWVRLREAGQGVDTVVDEAPSSQPDRAVIDAAVAARRALVTLDLGFADPSVPARRHERADRAAGA